MSISLTFSGSANSNYAPPSGAVLYGVMAYSSTGSGIRPASGNFSQLVDAIASETTGSAEAD